jgi:hypothetical protein
MLRRPVFAVAVAVLAGFAAIQFRAAWSVTLGAEASSVSGGAACDNCEQDCVPNGTTCFVPDPCNIGTVGEYCQHCPDPTTGEFCLCPDTAQDDCRFDDSHTCAETVDGKCHFAMGRYYCNDNYAWGSPSIGEPCSGWLYQCHED